MSAGLYAGFSDAAPWTVPIADYGMSNVALETGDPVSLLSHYRKLISLRNSHSALRVGDLNILETSNISLFASLRNSSTEAVLVVINLTNTSISNFRLLLNKSSLQSGEYVATPLMGAGPFADLSVNAIGGSSNNTPLPEIPAYVTLIVQLSQK